MSAVLKKWCFMILGSRVTPHLSSRGISKLGNIIRASCRPRSHSDTLVSDSNDGDRQWNWASGMENAKFGSWLKLRFGCMRNEHNSVITKSGQPTRCSNVPPTVSGGQWGRCTALPWGRGSLSWAGHTEGLRQGLNWRGRGRGQQGKNSFHVILNVGS